MPSVSIIGIGRMGGALAIALSDAGYKVQNLVHRGADVANRIADRLQPETVFSSSDSIPPLYSDVVLVTTSDPDIGPASQQLEHSLENRPVVLHTSGSLSSDVLANLAHLGCSTGSMHPLVSISDARSGARSFSNVYFCIEGDDPAQTAAREIVSSLGGRPFSIESARKPLYHAAAVTAAGHVTALVDVAIEMLSECGVDGATAQEILLPLIKSTVGNLETQTPAQALTGTFARVDAGAFQRHLSAMENVTPDLVRTIYLLLAERSLDLAGKNGANSADLAKLREGISIAKRKSE